MFEDFEGLNAYFNNCFNILRYLLHSCFDFV